MRRGTKKQNSDRSRGKRKESRVRDLSLNVVTISDLEFLETIYDEVKAINRVKSLKKKYKYVRRVKSSYGGRDIFRIYIGN